jgi:hypothetical protein
MGRVSLPMPSLLQSVARPVLCLALALGQGSAAVGAAFDVTHQRVTERDKGQGAGQSDGNARWGRLVVRRSTFREMVRSAQSRACQANKPPEPLATPNPVLDSADDLHLTVNFIVGTDGKVYSALILEGIKDEQARPVLDAVRHWRFRPAVCNGAPTESEAKVEFSTPPDRF